MATKKKTTGTKPVRKTTGGTTSKGLTRTDWLFVALLVVVVLLGIGTALAYIGTTRTAVTAAASAQAPASSDGQGGGGSTSKVAAAAPAANSAGPAAPAPVTSIDAAAPAAPANSGKSLTCSDGRVIPVPVNGQLFPANDGKVDYSVIYDPSQSGAADLKPLGWWYQPCLPGVNKDAHSVPIILQAGYYRFIGPECAVYLNTDGNHPNEQGTILVNRANNPSLSVPNTTGHGTEAWVYVTCRASDASGFSFALK